MHPLFCRSLICVVTCCGSFTRLYIRHSRQLVASMEYAPITAFAPSAVRRRGARSKAPNYGPCIKPEKGAYVNWHGLSSIYAHVHTYLMIVRIVRSCRDVCRVCLSCPTCNLLIGAGHKLLPVQYVDRPERSPAARTPHGGPSSGRGAAYEAICFQDRSVCLLGGGGLWAWIKAKQRAKIQ